MYFWFFINILYFVFCRWQILNEEIDCTEEEMMLFAALQLQVIDAHAHRYKVGHSDIVSPHDDEVVGHHDFLFVSKDVFHIFIKLEF